MTRCPICDKSVAQRPDNPFFPFCSERCKMIDLGRWLGEEYRVSVPEAPTPTPEPDEGVTR